MEHALSAAELLNVWERARSLPPTDGALLLMASADAGISHEKLAQFSIGRRDAELLRLREKLFGSRMAGRADCPACGQPMEMNFNVAEIQAAPPSEAAEHFTADFGEYEISFRLPNSSDLATLVPGEDVATQKRGLAQRCVLNATRAGQSFAAEQLPENVVGSLSEGMSELDPQGDVQLALTCPQCSHQWHAPLDIVSFVWSEIHAWAMRLLRDVHVLASSYGWREADILALSPWRRQAYLELIEQ
jgi:hypothetical protein